MKSLTRIGIFLYLSVAPIVLATTSIAGVLKAYSANLRYFTDGADVIYLTGSHNWNSLQDRGVGETSSFDYNSYLDMLESFQHNFLKLWVWEHAAWAPWTTEKFLFEPNPYVRSGPGTALDGKPKFNLQQFNQTYFDRLRSRALASQERGIYVGIMLFNGWSIGKKKGLPGNPWPGHPFNKDNNIDGVDGDLNGDGEGLELHTMTAPSIRALQEAYVRKVIDTVNDLDNVLYEIVNESHEDSFDWQEYMVDYIRTYEESLTKQHPVIVSVPYSYTIPNSDQFNEVLKNSSAEAISPNESGGYFTDPPANDGSKVILSDTDHFCGVCGDHLWVWKSFTRGLNPIFMDPIDDERWDLAREAMGDTREYAQRINLAAMSPNSEKCSSSYCLVDPGSEYLAYLPSGGTVTIDVSDAPSSKSFNVEWFNPTTGATIPGGATTGGGSRSLVAPFNGDAVLYLSAGAPLPFRFSLASINDVSLSPGDSATIPVQATLVSGSPESIVFAASGLPQGATAAFSTTSCRPTCTTVLTVDTSNTASTGTSTITVTANGANVSEDEPFLLTIRPPEFTFSLAVSGNLSVEQGASLSVPVTATLISGNPQPVSFTTSGLPQGATATFSTTSCSPTCTTTVTIATSIVTPAGTYAIGVNASGATSGAATVLLNVAVTASGGIPIEGLAAHWKLDEGEGTSTGDSSNERTGTLINGPIWTDGMIGKAVQFDGTNDYINLGSGGALNGTFSMSAWVKPSSDASGTIYAQGNSFVFISAGKLNYQANVPPWPTLSSPEGMVKTGVWNHVVVVHAGNGPQETKLFVNGVRDDDGDAIPSPNGSETSFIGRRSAGGYSHGAIDDVRVYSRALTDSEVAALFGGDPASSPSPTPPSEGDTLSPSTPSGVAGTATSPSSISLSWKPSTDNVAVTGYRISRNGANVTTVTGTSHIDSGLSASTSYLYTITALDALGNSSLPATISVSTPGLPAPPPAENNVFYVSPAGNPNGGGTIGDPWGLETAIAHPSKVKPGATIWLRGGTYSGFTARLKSYLTGTASEPVVVRQFPGERATIEGHIQIFGSHAWYWGFEVRGPDPNRRSNISVSWTPPDLKSGGVDVLDGIGTKLINLIVHDGNNNGIGAWSKANDTEIYGNIVYNSGWKAPDRAHGHGMYIQHKSEIDQPDEMKRLEDNVVFNNFVYGIQAFGSGDVVNNLDFRGNTLFNNGAPDGQAQYSLLLGSTSPATAITVVDNLFYQEKGTAASMGYYAGTAQNENLTLNDNLFVAPLTRFFRWQVIEATGNTFYGNISETTISGAMAKIDRSTNEVGAAKPTAGETIVIRPNKFESERTTIIVYNWGENDTVSVDLSGVLNTGDAYEIRDVQNYFSSPLLSGAYNGGLLSLPMNGLTIAAPVGSVPVSPKHTGPGFGVFVVIRKG